MIRKLAKHWFLLGLFGVVALSLAAPVLGATADRGGWLSTATIVAMFVVSGLSLPSEDLRRGLTHFRAHVFCHVFLFVFTPAMVYLTTWWMAGIMDGRMLAAVYGLAVLPTTVSSCIILTQLAGGRTATAIFNAVGSNCIGVFLSPLLLTWMLRQTGHALPWHELVNVFGSLVLKVLLPFAAGQVLHVRLRGFVERRRKGMSIVAAMLVLVIVFASFSKAAADESLLRNVARLGGPVAYLYGGNILLMLLAWWAGRIVGLDRGDRIAAVFVCPQKTIALGVPLLAMYFASDPTMAGIAVLAILLYHPWQLLTAGVARGILHARSHL